MRARALLAGLGGLFLLAGLATAGEGAVASDKVRFSPDFGASFAIEAQHLAHFALRLKGIHAGDLDATGRHNLRSAMWPKLWKYACSLPQRNAKVFDYVRNPAGVIELDMMDEAGRSISVFKVRWATCHN